MPAKPIKPAATITVTFVVPLDVDTQWAQQMLDALQQIQSIQLTTGDVKLELPNEVFIK